MRLMDVMTTYLYILFDTDIYMKIPEGLKLPKSCKVSSREHCLIILNKSLYGLKQSGRMQYNHLRTPDLGKTKICLGLQIEHLKDGILVHQETYIEKVLKRSYMDKSHPLSTPMVVRSLDVEKDHFRPPTDDEDILGPEVPYLSAIGALMFLAGHTRPDISLFKFISEIQFMSYKETLEWSTKDLGLYFANPSKGSLYGFADAGYLSDPHTGRSQTGYVFTIGGTAIPWCSTKQTMVATSSNHVEILAIHEASRECLRNVIQHIRRSCGIVSDKEPPTVLYEDNAACIAQLKEGYIKGDRTKHILPKFFFTHDLQKSGDISIQQVCSCENLADLFTKSLLNSTFQTLVHGIGMRRLKDLK
ncbi:LOW QUALITY PROTEIN: hypothetical protein OSB04_012037 [Centaurea solstitialis]|uniref:Reverse transcriptase Ty1/copia-type domain-containing protein n=1 Tax=Centaurea solstitialis TaxID=347529 RepID=A0AA38TVE8_9ASTR|nr:LOW QUALITY PROTEIN: hypothetical protein OSB04_012037 [Centaurea solstitialis]